MSSDFQNGFMRTLENVGQQQQRQHQMELQRRQFRQSEDAQRFNQIMSKRDDFRANEASDRADAQLELKREAEEDRQKSRQVQREKNQAQMERVKMLTDQERELHSSNLRESEANANLRESQAAVAEIEEVTATDELLAGRGDQAYRMVSGTSVDEYFENPALLAEHSGMMSSVLGGGVFGQEGEEGSSIIKRNGKYYEASVGENGYEFMKDDDGNRVELSEGEVRQTMEFMRNRIDHAASFGGGGSQRSDQIRSLVESATLQARTPVRTGDGPNQVRSVDSVQGEIDELSGEEQALRKARYLGMTDSEQEKQAAAAQRKSNSASRYRNHGGPGGQGGLADMDNSSETPINELDEEEVEQRISELSPEEQVFARSVQNRGEDVVRTLDNLKNRDLPKAKQAQRHNRQAEQARTNRPAQIEERTAFVENYEAVNGERLTGEQVNNLIRNGGINVTDADVTKQQRKAVEAREEFVEDVVSYADTNDKDEGGRGVPTSRWKGMVRSQIENLRTRNPQLFEKFRTQGPGAFYGAMEEAQVLAEKAGTGGPNLQMALELQRHNVSADKVGQGLSHVFDANALGTDKLGPQGQTDLALGIAEKMEGNSNMTPERAAGQVWNDMQTQKRRDQGF